MPKVGEQFAAKMNYRCAACGGTGKNSKGGPCHPCAVNAKKYVEGLKQTTTKSNKGK